MEVGRLGVTDSTWAFSGSVADVSSDVWGSATVTNTSCSTPYRPGTAQAGAAIFTASLMPAPSSGGGASYQGALTPFVGSAGRGQLQVGAAPGSASGISVVATLTALEPQLAGTTLRVCLTLATLPPSLAQIDVNAQLVAARGYDVTGVVTAPTADGHKLIAIAGSQAGADPPTQWVFFFLDTAYLGTDTAVPSTQLQLVGSAGPGSVDVQYADNEGGEPVVIRYTWTSEQLEPDGTPPGH